MLKNFDNVSDQDSEYFMMRNISPDNSVRPDYQGYHNKKYTDNIKEYLKKGATSPGPQDTSVSDLDSNSIFNKKDIKLRIISK